MKNDFWPPIQGGHEILNGVFVALEDVVSALENRTVTRADLESEDEGALSDLLEDIFHRTTCPPPDRVVWFSRKHVRGTPDDLKDTNGYFAYWPAEVWRTATGLREILKNCKIIGPLSISYKYSRFIPAGADAVIWLVVLIGLVTWLLVR